MKQVVLCSKHRKAEVIAPVLAPVGFVLTEDSRFDTDSLGTFSGEIERSLSPLEAAKFKAQKACELSGADYGLGSEGSFGGGPMPGLVNWNEEVLCLYQASTGHAVYAQAAQPVSVQNFDAESREEIRLILAELPGQMWIQRKAEAVFKGLSADQILTSLDSLEGHFPYTIEPDYRAMHCPERRKVIGKAAEDLATRLQSLCPSCGASDFVVKKVEKGLPCRQCTLPTEQVKTRIKICAHCGHQQVEPVEALSADPMHCQHCNP